MPEPKPIIIERTINAPIARVWQALSDPQALKQWLPFFPDFQPKVGFRTAFELGPDDDHQYRHVVEVLEVVVEQKLTYSWDYGGISPGSSISFELSAAGDQTKLVVTARIDRVPGDQPDFLKNAIQGWTYTADGLKAFAEKPVT